jgi:hypothetical protein
VPQHVHLPAALTSTERKAPIGLCISFTALVCECSLVLCGGESSLPQLDPQQRLASEGLLVVPTLRYLPSYQAPCLPC